MDPWIISLHNVVMDRKGAILALMKVVLLSYDLGECLRIIINFLLYLI